jgi:NAD(P)-dependent dehydrogenase (short-subunit alcohol dehydrogenase family)
MSQKPPEKPRKFEPQRQERQPGAENQMHPEPAAESAAYPVSGKLKGKVALITGGDRGIGRAVAILFAKEGANIAIVYYNEHQDAADTKTRIEELGKECLTIAGDVGYEPFCRESVQKVIKKYDRIDILVNNAAVQFPKDSLEDISTEQLEHTFRTNILSMFFITRAALKYMPKGSSIINTTSVTAYRGSKHLIDYSSTKGAIVSFTRSLSLSLADKGIRVNGVAPGPVWTSLIPASFPPEDVAKFGTKEPLQRAGQPFEIAPSFLFLASNEDSSYINGQILHPNGGEIING